MKPQKAGAYRAADLFPSNCKAGVDTSITRTRTNNANMGFIFY